MSSRIDALVARTVGDPHGAIAEANALLDHVDIADRCRLLRVLGNAHREVRHTAIAREHHEAAFALASTLGDPTLEGLTAMSLAATLTYDGEFDRAVALGQHAESILVGDDRITALIQLAGILRRAGRLDEAAAAFEAAAPELELSTDRSVAVEFYINRGVLHGVLGQSEQAESDTREALALCQMHALTKRGADVCHNLGWLAGLRGDIVEALRQFDMAADQYDAAHVDASSVFPDRCEALLAAGLATEALTLAERSAAALSGYGDAVDRAEALMLAARAAIMSGRFERGLGAAREAAAIFERQGRLGWSAGAEILAVECGFRLGTGHWRRDLERARALSRAAGSFAAARVDGVLLAAEIAVSCGWWESARTDLARTDRRTLGVVARARRDYAEARLMIETESSATVLAHCAESLERLRELSAGLMGTEMRSAVLVHANELASLALHVVVGQGDEWATVEWVELQRSLASTPITVRPARDPELAASAGRLRSTLQALEQVRADGRPDGALAEQARVLVQGVRSKARSASRGAQAVLWEPRRPVLDMMSCDPDATWVLLFRDLMNQYVAIVRDGDVVVRTVGSHAEVTAASLRMRGSLLLELRAAARGVVRPTPALDAAALDLDALLFGAFDGFDLNGKVVVCPPSDQHDIAWGLLPSLVASSVVVVPSLETYAACRSRVAPTDTERILAIAGPGLSHADEECSRVVGAYGGGDLAVGRCATVDRVLDRLASTAIVHMACHGHIVRDNPMFSSLECHDGSLFVHELETLPSVPEIAVLSACQAGANVSTVDNAVLGFANSLLVSGARSVIASSVPVPDNERTADVVHALHCGLAAEADPATALRAARAADHVVGGAFACYGASWR